MRNREQGCATVIIRTRNHQRFKVEMQFGICLEFFLESSYCFGRFQSDGEFISDPRRSYRESTFAQIKLSFRNNKLL